MAEPLIELRNVSKHFAGVRALTDVSIAVHPGEVVCLLGDNGAGKSTLIKILSGFHPPSSGSICLDGQETRFADPRDAREAGRWRHRGRPPRERWPPRGRLCLMRCRRGAMDFAPRQATLPGSVRRPPPRIAGQALLRPAGGWQWND